MNQVQEKVGVKLFFTSSKLRDSTVNDKKMCLNLTQFIIKKGFLRIDSASIAEYKNIMSKIRNGITFLTCHVYFNLGQRKNKSEELAEKYAIYTIRKYNK